MNLINLLKSLGTYINFVKHLNQLMKYRFAKNKTLKLPDLTVQKRGTTTKLLYHVQFLEI